MRHPRRETGASAALAPDNVAARCKSALLEAALAALAAKPPYFGARDADFQIAVARNLPLQILVKLAFELAHLAAANAGHVDVVSRSVALIEVPMAAKMKKIEFIDQAVLLEKFERAIDGDARDVRIDFLRVLKYLPRIEMLRSALHHLQYHTTLPGETYPARTQFPLEAPKRLVLVDAFAGGYTVS
jgi:hypothetical protein